MAITATTGSRIRRASIIRIPAIFRESDAASTGSADSVLAWQEIHLGVQVIGHHNPTADDQRYADGDEAFGEPGSHD